MIAPPVVVLRMEPEVMPEIAKAEEVAFERVVLPAKVLAPVKRLESARSVEDAAVMVIELPAVKEVLLIVPRMPER